jgi:hypothetical protein
VTFALRHHVGERGTYRAINSADEDFRHGGGNVFAFAVNCGFASLENDFGHGIPLINEWGKSAILPKHAAINKCRQPGKQIENQLLRMVLYGSKRCLA